MGGQEGQEQIRNQTCVGDVGGWPRRRYNEVRKVVCVGVGAKHRGRETNRCEVWREMR